MPAVSKLEFSHAFKSTAGLEVKISQLQVIAGKSIWKVSQTSQSRPNNVNNHLQLDQSECSQRSAKQNHQKQRSDTKKEKPTVTPCRFSSFHFRFFKTKKSLCSLAFAFTQKTTSFGSFYSLPACFGFRSNCKFFPITCHAKYFLKQLKNLKHVCVYVL